jgi:hypothetical protein
VSEPLPFVAFAAPDGSGWGLALGPERVLDPGLRPEVADELPRLMSAAGELTALTVNDVPALSGTLPELQRGSSLRLAVALFDHGRVFGLSALRPRRARGHDQDEYQALVQEEGAAWPVDDPRLSVTSDAAARPLRVGLELWLAPAEEQSDEPTYDFPRRAAGQVEPAGTELVLGELTATAHRVRWRSRGEDGSGWFVIVQAR